MAPSAPNAHEIAKARVHIGQSPSWATSVSYDRHHQARPGDTASQLLLVREQHAERHQVYCRSVLKLETIEGVRDLGQFRIDFDPTFDIVTVHWIRVRRGEHEVEHAESSRFRILQREEGLERLVIDGMFTLLVLLEDVRPGDIIDTAFTIESSRPILPEHAFEVFSLPAHPVARFQFSMRFRSDRPMQWKSQGNSVKPVESHDGLETLWQWNGENHQPPLLEFNTPTWHRSQPWIEMSDCRDWSEVASALARAWNERSREDDAAIDLLAQDIMAAHPVPSHRINRALEIIQDEHRYLSLRTDRGGHIPAPPSMVVRRRYGDCKDLALLATALLSRLGVTAHPILVNTSLGSTLREVLPSPWFFNHAIIEFECEAQRRWVDLTLPRQGGGAFNRVAPDFRVGLLLDERSGSLVDAPPASVEPGLYECRETLLLATDGKPSLLSVVVTATRDHADHQRRRFATTPVEELRRQEMQVCANRFNKASWGSELVHRDDRERNQFVTSAIFEVDGFLSSSNRPACCALAIPPNPALQLLPIPERRSPSDPPRRAPFALPHPWKVRHVFEVESPALPLSPVKGSSVSSSFVEFTRTPRHLYHHWAVTYEFTTLCDHVSADQLSEYAETVEAIWRQSLFEYSIPVGYARPRRRDDFGALPDGTEISPPSIETRESEEMPAAQREINPPVEATSTASTGAERPAPRPEITGLPQSSITPIPADSRPESLIDPRDLTPRRRRRQTRSHHWFTVVAATIFAILFTLYVIAVVKAVEEKVRRLHHPEAAGEADDPRSENH